MRDMMDMRDITLKKMDFLLREDNRKNVIPTTSSVIPATFSVIPAKAGIQEAKRNGFPIVSIGNDGKRR